MKKRLFFNEYRAALVTASVFLLCVLLVVLIHVNPGFVRHADAVTPFFILQPDSVLEEAIPDYAGVRRTYTFRIPETHTVTTTGARLTFYLRHTIAQFSVEDSSLAVDLSEEGTPHIGKTPGNYWASMPMRPAYAGKTVRVTLTPVYDSVRDETPVFLIITRDALLTMMELPKDGLLLVLSLVSVAAGLFLALIVLATPLDRQEKRRVFLLGAVTVTAGLWKLCGLPTVTLLLDYLGIHKEIWYAGVASYLLMLVLSLRILTMIRKDADNRIGMLCFYLSSGIAALLVLLQILRITELHEVLIWFGVGMAMLHLVSLFGQKPAQSELLWLLPFFLTLGIDLLIYFITGSMRGAPAFLIWIMLDLFLGGFSFAREAIRRERELRTKEEELRDARIQTMMNQIRPHFIYNTLTSIYVLCKDDPERAGRVVSDFTDYLQANFTAIAATEPASFEDELRHTKAYIAVESVLYGDRLCVEYDTKYLAFRLPPLTLQPLVENAVKHGLGGGQPYGHIMIRSRAENGCAVITVEDDGPGIGPESEDSEEHIGLANVRERLEIMCGGMLDAAPRMEGGTIVTVTIPQDQNGLFP